MTTWKLLFEVNSGEYEDEMYIKANDVKFGGSCNSPENEKDYCKFNVILVDGIEIMFPTWGVDITKIEKL